MSENENNNEKTENRGENLVNVTNEYNENERPDDDQNESILDETVGKVKAGAKAVINKAKDTGRDINSQYNKEKQSQE